MTQQRKITPLFDRFWAKVEVIDGCWEWTGYKNNTGYGSFMVEGGAVRLAHRVSYEMHRGAIPKTGNHRDTCVLHRCDNRRCVNPDHLFIGTDADNAADKVAKGRVKRLFGSANGRTKLTKSDVIAIRAAKGATQREIGESFGISHTHVRNILTGKHWKLR